jgi:hypothetical protein
MLVPHRSPSPVFGPACAAADMLWIHERESAITVLLPPSVPSCMSVAPAELMQNNSNEWNAALAMPQRLH